MTQIVTPAGRAWTVKIVRATVDGDEFHLWLSPANLDGGVDTMAAWRGMVVLDGVGSNECIWWLHTGANEPLLTAAPARIEALDHAVNDAFTAIDTAVQEVGWDAWATKQRQANASDPTYWTGWRAGRG